MTGKTETALWQREFHLSRRSREKYRIDESLFRVEGDIGFIDFTAVQRFANQLKEKKARAGELNAVGLIHEVFHIIIGFYLRNKNKNAWDNALKMLDSRLGQEKVDEALRYFASEFPPPAVYRDKVLPEVYIKGETAGVPNRHILLEEMSILAIFSLNPACELYKTELFDDRDLKSQTDYWKVFSELERFFIDEPYFGPDSQDLITMLKSPAKKIPHSLHGQLQYIRAHWGFILGDFISRLLSGLDLLKEEEKFGGMGPGDTPVYDFSGGTAEYEYESFSRDHAWMPRLVLMAKSTYVWLDQLSKKYRRSITHLDQIPDEELDEMSRRGFTGLWLIGVWERSRASQRIKQMCGNPEALASAYSIYDYRIADDLGGDEAIKNLRYRAWLRGIRMASDMVPNHMGIDSPWVVEHPEWFLSLDSPPYPVYSFNGPNLSPDPRVTILLEDRYYTRQDAAVVFKWVNNSTGETRYIYHGNDGTSTPWNDTAQLNYLNPQVREAVVSAIFSVSSNFSIIRFDAAMTLTKRHYQRLWFPEPGSGGDIPSRSWQGMGKSEFNRMLPDEFWRQVVDRFAEAKSDTLLLAEAFWLMEAYFVRTLGMHRVYNSAFMNFLKNEDNAQYRQSIKNVLLFNPEILKRFVNFMNNPDEETALAQFGKDDKYFGVCTLMAALPGLPMFGHGQIDGFTEKYGMEYRRAYYNESPDLHLIQRHEHEIFPLLRKRYLFAEVSNFLFYDFYTTSGSIDENVIAFSNRLDSERCIVVYHNKFSETSGWIKTSVSYMAKQGPQNTESIREQKMVDGLGLTPEDNHYVIFSDHAAGLQYIRDVKEMGNKGLYFELSAYKKNVFLDFREVIDDERKIYFQLNTMLQGKGVPNIDDILRRHFFNPLKTPFQDLVECVFKGDLTRLSNPGTAHELRSFYEAVHSLTGNSEDPFRVVTYLCRMVEVLDCQLRLESFAGEKIPLKTQFEVASVSKFLQTIGSMKSQGFFKPIMLSWVFLHRIGWHIVEEWMLDGVMAAMFKRLGADEVQAWQFVETARLLVRYQDWWKNFDSVRQWADHFFQDFGIVRILNINNHNGSWWFHKESADELLNRLYITGILSLVIEEEDFQERITSLSRVFRFLRAAVQRSGYNLDTFKKIIYRVFPK